jgi:pimeloyl-ACP methyl ester carboxylesterase
MVEGLRRVASSVGLAAGVIVLAVLLVAAYVYRDRERSTLDDEARRGAPGSFVKLGDGVVHYELAGPSSGRTVVLVPGFSAPYVIWEPTFHALVAAGLRVLRYDLYGRGLSDRPDVLYDADLYERQLVQLLDALGIQGPVDVAGVSMGGPIAVGFALRHPERTRTVTLVDPAYRKGDVMPWAVRAPLVGAWLMDVVVAPSLPRGQLDDFHDPRGLDEYVARYRAQMCFPGFRRALLSTIRCSSGKDDGESFRALGAGGKAVLLVWGREDRSALAPFARSEDVLRAIPHAEFHPVDQAGHLPQYERADVVNPILLAFLGEH